MDSEVATSLRTGDGVAKVASRKMVSYLNSSLLA